MSYADKGPRRKVLKKKHVPDTKQPLHKRGFFFDVLECGHELAIAFNALSTHRYCHLCREEAKNAA